MEESMSNLIQAVLAQLQQEGYTEKGIKKHSRTFSLLMSYANQMSYRISLCSDTEQAAGHGILRTPAT